MTAKTYPDRVKCPKGHSFVVSTRRVGTAGKKTKTYCQMCQRTYQIKAGPLPKEPK